jgi:hypothetical protein
VRSALGGAANVIFVLRRIRLSKEQAEIGSVVTTICRVSDGVGHANEFGIGAAILCVAAIRSFAMIE